MINVLIVEDDFRIADIHEGYLRTITSIQDIYKVNLARDAAQVIEENEIELVLVDIYMPDQLGIDLIRDLKKQYPTLNFIIITAANSSQLLEESLRIGVFYYLIKPVTLKKFEEVIHKFENRKAMIHSTEHVDQTMVDTILKRGALFINGEADGVYALPKGINTITLSNVKDIVKGSKNGLTVDDISEILGSSRTTARRYLEYLVSIHQMKAEIEYGIVGRPQRKYISTIN